MMRVFVPAEGVLGLLSWAREHVEECCAGKEEEGIAFRAWSGPYGAKGDVCKAEASSDDVVSKDDHLVQAVYRLWAMSSCGLLEIERHGWSYSTHAFHGTWTDVARMVGESPTLRLRSVPRWQRALA